MTKDAVERVLQHLLAATREVSESVRVVQAEATEPEFRKYRLAASEVMGAVYLDLIKVLVKDYPELDPGRDPE